MDNGDANNFYHLYRLYLALSEDIWWRSCVAYVSKVCQMMIQMMMMMMMMRHIDEDPILASETLFVV